jgi:hypothetical protein
VLGFRPKGKTKGHRPNYGHHRIREFPQEKDKSVRQTRFENHTLAEFIENLRRRSASGAWQELLERYDAPRSFPDLANFRLGPNPFGLTALDWIVFRKEGGRASSLVAHGITTRIRWSGESTDLPRGWTGAVRQSYENSVLGDESPNTLIGLFIFAETAFREHGWAAEVAEAMKELAREEGMHSLIIPLRLPTRYEWQNARLPYAEFALRKRDDGEFADHWLRMHTRLGARVIGTCDVSHQHAFHSDDLPLLFECDPIERTGSYIVRSHGEHYAAYVDLERECAVINEGCVWVRYHL